MADQNFFHNTGPHSLAVILESGLANVADHIMIDQCIIVDVKPLSEAQRQDLSFLDNRKYAADLKETQAGFCFVRPADQKLVPENTIALVTDQPYVAYALAAQLFYPTPKAVGHISESAHISFKADIDESCEIGPGVVVGDGVRIAEGCIIAPYVTISENVRIGKGTQIGSHCSISHAYIGNNCQIHPGVRIGQRGFGFAMTPKGHVEVPQLGRVLIGDNVEIGANTTIDRGAGPDTIIGSGTRIDNLVQIGHNVQIGENSVIVAQSGIAGSTKVGNFVVIAAQAGVAGHLKIEDGAVCVARAGVMRDVSKGEHVGGTPAVAHKQWLKQEAFLRRQVK